MTRYIVKTGEQICFESWANDHKFLTDWDDEMKIYTSPFTQGAWMAWEESHRQAWACIENREKNHA